MERCQVPWSETPPPLPSSPKHQHLSVEDPKSNEGSPAAQPSPSSPDAIHLAYTTTVEPHPETITVIRQGKSMSPEPNPGGEQLVYQQLGDSSNFIGHYGLNYVSQFSPTSTSGAAGSQSPYSYVKVPCYQEENIRMVQGYEADNGRAASPHVVQYTTALPYAGLEAHLGHPPMWGPPLTSGNNNYAFSSGLEPTVLDNSEVSVNNRSGYSSYGGSTYMLASSDPTWPLPSMPSSPYLQEGRRSQYTEPPPEYGRLNETPQHQCAVCGSTDSSPWKRDACGQVVCNNCCIYKNGVAARASAIRPQRRLTTSRRVGMTCSNCSTTDTTLWRRNTQGEPVCNACGLYYKLHQVNRPISMRKDSIQTRKRKPKSGGSSKSKGHASSTSTSNGLSSKASTSSSVTSSSSPYLPQGSLEGDDTPHRAVHSPLVPSSSTLSQQLPHFPPLDPPHGTDIILDSQIVLEPHTSVISVAPNKQQLG